MKTGTRREQWLERMRSDKRCPWCKILVSEDEPAVSKTACHITRRSHFSCEEAALRRHVWIYYGFLVMAIVSAISAIPFALSNLPLRDKWQLITASLGGFGLVRFIRPQIRDWSDLVREQKDQIAEKPVNNG